MQEIQNLIGGLTVIVTLSPVAIWAGVKAMRLTLNPTAEQIEEEV